MKILFRVILLILFVNCQNNQLTKNVSEKKITTYQKDFTKVDTIKTNSFFTSNREETFEEFLQRAKSIASSDDDDELKKLIEFPLTVRGLDENLKVFEDKFYTFNEVKDNIMLYEGILKEGLKSAINISKGNCTFFRENKNCFSIYMDVWKTTFDFVLKKQKGKYKIVAVQIPAA